MASFHEIKASASPRPGESGTPSAPNQGHYFGWDAIRRLQQPPPEMQIVSQTAVTPRKILRAMRGEFEILPSQPTANPRGRGERVLSEWERLKQEREQRRKATRDKHSNGNR